MRNRRSHLQTLMGVDAIEGLFVTVPPEQEALFHPMTKFHPRMVSDECVMLSSQYFL